MQVLIHFQNSVSEFMVFITNCTNLIYFGRLKFLTIFINICWEWMGSWAGCNFYNFELWNGKFLKWLVNWSEGPYYGNTFAFSWKVINYIKIGNYILRDINELELSKGVQTEKRNSKLGRTREFLSWGNFVSLASLTPYCFKRKKWIRILQVQGDKGETAFQQSNNMQY